MLLGKVTNKYYLKYALFFLTGVVALVLVDYFQLYIPEYLGDMVSLLDSGKEVTLNDVLYIVKGLVVVALVMFTGRIVWRFAILNASQRIEANIRHEMFLKAERLSQRYYHENKVGTIMAWFSTDLETIEEFLGWGSIMMVDAIFLSIMAITKMVTLDWVLSIIAFLPMLLIIVLGAMFEKQMGERWEHRQKEFDRLYDFSQENFTGIRVIKAFVKEMQEIHAFNKVAKENQKANLDFVRVHIFFEVLISLVITIIIAIIMGVGGYFVYASVNGTPVVILGHEIILEAGKLVTFIGYFDTLVWPMMAIGQLVSMHSRSKTSLKRVERFLDEEEEIQNVENAHIFDEIKGKITFKNFNFMYPDARHAALHDISLEIHAGEMIGVVGKIGSGKTTLVNTLLRLYNVDKGTLFIDDVDIMDIHLHNLREHVSYVPQDNFLFSDSVKNNIAFSNRHQSFANIQNAAKFADVDDNIVNFTSGYDTITGERGVTLSGGQKQRISIARAYIKDAPIMIMDDSVSAVDVKTEENILNNIREKRKGKTTIVIASRVSTVSDLDRILVLNEGRVEAFDTHENLMNISPTYQKMVYLQELEREVSSDV